MTQVPIIDYEAIFRKHAGRPLVKTPYIRPGIEGKKPKDKLTD